MANEGRFLGKQLVAGEGIIANPSSAIVRESDNSWDFVGGMRVGSGQPVVLLASVLASIDFAQIEPSGSTGAKTTDVALAGVTPGDQCFAAPTQSVPDHIVWGAACYSAGVVNVRVLHTASGNIDLAATNWRVSALRFG